MIRNVNLNNIRFQDEEQPSPPPPPPPPGNPEWIEKGFPPKPHEPKEIEIKD